MANGHGGARAGAGQPTKYRPEMCGLAHNYARLGATEQQMAEMFGVDRATFATWKAQHEAFGAAVNDGKMIADDEVERSLFRRATGYRHIAFKILQCEGKAFAKRYVEHYPPDTTACIFWLKNRRRDQWRDQHDHKHSGHITMAELVNGSLATEKTDG